MDSVQHIFELVEEDSSWEHILLNHRTEFRFRIYFYNALTELDESQRVALVAAFDEVERPVFRYGILEAIDFLNLPVDTERWLTVLNNPDEDVRVRAKAGAILTRDLEVADVLLHELVRDGQPKTIRNAIYFGFSKLIQNKHPETLEHLIVGYLQQFERYEDRFLIFDYLSSLLSTYKSPLAFETLCSYVRDNHPDIKTFAISALGVVGDVRAIPIIIECLGEHPQVNGQAITTLWRLHMNLSMILKFRDANLKKKALSERP